MSDELIEQMVMAGQAAISPVLEEAYTKTDAEIGVLEKLWGLIEGDGQPLPHNRQRGMEMLERLQRPVLIDIAVAVVQAIDDAASGTDQYIVSDETLQTLRFDRADTARRMGLKPPILDLVIGAMTSKLARLVEQQERSLVVDGKTTRLTRPAAVTVEQEKALAALEEAARSVPENVFIAEPLAELYLATGRVARAAEVCGAFAMRAQEQKLRGSAARLWRICGVALEAKRDLSAACGAYEQVLRNDPSDVSTMSTLGRLYFASANWEKARSVYQQLVHIATLEDTRRDAFLALGEVHLKLGHAPEARTTFERGLEASPKLLDALVVAEQLGQQDT